MSTYQSNLSLPQFGYDMTVSTTQAAIDATIKEFLSAFEGREFISCYSYDFTNESVNVVPMPYDKVLEIAGLNPFDIPQDKEKQSPEQQAALKRLYDNDFAFGFKAKIGLPEGFPLDSIPSIVVFDRGDKMVTYNQFFNNFSLINLEDFRGRAYIWQNLTQMYDPVDSPEPWVFKYSVNLDLNADDTGSVFGNLPKSVQDRVKNLNPDSAFSVEQLYLDLNTAGLLDTPSLEGLDKSSKAYFLLTTVFINTYFDTIKKESVSSTNPNGNFLLGYTIKPVKPSSVTPSIKPTDLNIMISPYYDSGGHANGQLDLYTLNYLVMSNDNIMPPANKFGWNWIDSNEQADYHGTMSIKKSIFSTFLNNLLSPSLNNICLIPDNTLHVNLISVSWDISFKKDTNPITYTPVNNDTTKVLTLHYEQSQNLKDNAGTNWANLNTTVTIDSDIFLEDKILRTVTIANVFCHINIEGGVTAGNFVRYKTETSYEIGVDESGVLTAKLAPDSPKFTDESDNINPNGWSKFVTVGQVKRIVDDVKNEWSSMKTFLIGHDRNIESMLNGSGAWVFPGGKTFIFKDAAFSNFQDFTAHITYIDPQ